MKITVPATVDVIANLITGEKVTEAYEFAKHFICLNVLLDKKWATSMGSLYLAWDLRALFAGKKPGDVVELTHDQHQALREAVECPTSPMEMALAVQIRTYYEAVICPTGSA